MKPIRIGKELLYPQHAALALAIGAAGALLARLGGLPLPSLLGSMALVAALSVLAVKPFGLTPSLPQNLRMGFIPIIGVAIGGAFSPALLQEAGRWWPTLLALLVYIPAAHFLGFQIYRRLGRIDPATALFASVPGGLLESIAMGEAAGADIRMLTMLQFMRLIFCIVLVPLGFALLTGELVGSAGGVRMTGSDVPLHLRDIAVLTAAAVIGATLGARIGLPGWMITGPVLASGLAHLTGLTAAVPPQWLIEVTQLVIGTSLGIRFQGLPKGAIRKALGLAFLAVTATLALAYVAALLLHAAVGQHTSAVFLAFAPGGLAEMSLVALSLHVSVIYVTAHHVARIVLAVFMAQLAGRWIVK